MVSATFIHTQTCVGARSEELWVKRGSLQENPGLAQCSCSHKNRWSSPTKTITLVFSRVEDGGSKQTNPIKQGRESKRGAEDRGGER
jgi:hypothetical protein